MSVSYTHLDVYKRQTQFPPLVRHVHQHLGTKLEDEMFHHTDTLGQFADNKTFEK